MNKQQKTVFVGLSGGVDSSVAALRLKEAGYQVVGVFIKVWHPEWLRCDWEAERLSAMRVAAHLSIPFLTCDAAAAYKQEVADYFIQSYQDGLTPNPDILCNQHVKFGAFLQFATDHGADYVATGHYARRIEDGESGTDLQYQLQRGVDQNKDQSYFLWTLTQPQLAKILLPVGRSSKDEIRREAAAAALPTASKKDSQGICFLGHIDIKEFLAHYASLEPGVVRDENGNEIGEHEGALLYTLGQRHGFQINTAQTATRPHYVVGKSREVNEIPVSPPPPHKPVGSTITLSQCNWISSSLPVGAPGSMLTCQAQFRYRQTPVSVAITDLTNKTATITLHETTDRPAAGQSCVLYDGMRCLGGGVVNC